MESKSSRTSDVFVNEGFARWQRLRAEWVHPRTECKQTARREVKAKDIDVDQVIDRIFAQTSGGVQKDLPTPLPLGQMVDILIDFWEADGMFD
jgi:hypothetical protein